MNIMHGDDHEYTLPLNFMYKFAQNKPRIIACSLIHDDIAVPPNLLLF